MVATQTVGRWYCVMADVKAGDIRPLLVLSTQTWIPTFVGMTVGGWRTVPSHRMVGDRHRLVCKLVRVGMTGSSPVMTVGSGSVVTELGSLAPLRGAHAGDERCDLGGKLLGLAGYVGG